MINKTIPILDLKPQYNRIKSEVQAAVESVMESGRFIMGPEVKTFEQEVAQYLGVKYAIGVNSGTDALVIGLRAVGIKPGDEVITTPFSFFATAESIGNVGAQVVFADIDPKTYNIDPEAILAKITPRTKAILPVHLYGQPAAMGRIMEIARDHNLKVIEDCAQSFGARYWGESQSNFRSQETTHVELAGRATGTLGDVGAFSFFPSKNLGAYGDGGLIVTNNDDIAQTAQMLRVHGARKKYHNEVLGYNSRLDTIQAAILRVKLNYIDEWNQGRRRVAQQYNQGLAEVESIISPENARGHVFHQYTIRVTGGRRDYLKEALAKEGISTMIYYPIPQDRLAVYQNQHPPCPISDQAAQEVLSLPIWPELEESVINLVINALKDIIQYI